MSRDGNWIETVSGRRFWPLDPREEDIDLEDIAHALSMLCRFNGHCDRFYSVAEHSFLVSTLVPEHAALYGLMHDAAEAYLGDVPTPIKRLLPTFQAAEKTLLDVILKRYGIVPTADELRAVAEADERLLKTEHILLFHNNVQWSFDDPASAVMPYEAFLRADGLMDWMPTEAYDNFIERFHYLYRKAAPVDPQVL